MISQEQDIFIHRYIYPDASSVFKCTLKPIGEIKDNCIVILDTNVLLVPYTLSKDSLDNIDREYKKLKEQNRLFIPAQVAREFATNRPKKITETYQRLKQKRENIIYGKTSKGFAVLKELDSYKNLMKYEKEINRFVEKYRQELDNILNSIKEWIWNDPISISYKEIFDESNIIDIEIKETEKKKEKKGIEVNSESSDTIDVATFESDFQGKTKNDIESELKKRICHKIPPGYKDKGKPDSGIGDLLIWHTILKIAKEKNRDVIFISGDEKNDWWYQCDKQTIYPRFELISEFYRETCGKTIHILKLSDFLRIYNVSGEIIEEVENEERPLEETLPDNNSQETKPYKEG